eukprot:Phypoly_transcript_10874.p1 GENE.Phypoly_transcript_10874~~Phypoly_transcript_10874.p1  ORF type:complete len:353 (+),score=76.60 Phypoly_transcript_10874:81-1061(+)
MGSTFAGHMLVSNTICEKGPANVTFSPFSISSALAMTSAGAQGTTAEEIHKTLFPSVKGDPHKVFESFTEVTKGSPSFVIANSIFLEAKRTLKPEFKGIVEKSYGASVQQVDFAGNPTDSCAQINKWVEDKTKEKIKNLVPTDAIDTSTVLVLVNAIYFKVGWLHPFDPKVTADKPFYELGSKKESMVKMMHQKKSFGFREIEGATLVELPYNDRQFSMLIVLPKDNSQKAWESIVNKDFLQSVEKKGLENRQINLYLPRFKVTWKSDLKPILQELGIKAAFGPQADFHKMITEKEDIFISNVIHQAVVEVNEEGTEAAAATAVVV